MDPVTVLSIAGSAAAAAQGAVDVVLFFRDAKNLHKAGDAFAEEIGALGAACDIVHHRLQQVVKDYEANAGGGQGYIAGRGQLWDYLKTQITACRKTILDFRDAVVDTQGVSKDTNLLEKVFRQARLNMKAADITEARNRIRSHTMALQSVLSCISIEISYLAPKHADQTLQTQLSELIEQNKELSNLLSKQNSVVQNDQINETAILQVSDQIISSGQTLYAESIAGGSVFGGLDPSKHESITSWLHDADIIDIQSSENSTTEQDRKSIFSAANGPGADTQTTSSHPPSPVIRGSAVGSDGQNYDSDFDDDYLVDIAKHSIASGRQAFESDDFREAQSTLEEALKLVLELPINQRRICNTSEIRYMLSVCSFHLDTPQIAKTALLGVIESKTDSSEKSRGAQICEVGHMLAQTFIKLGELEQARMHCESALSGRRRLLGQTHRETWESWALRAKIWDLSGNPRRAKLMLDMVPAEEQSLLEKFDSLDIETTSNDMKPSASSNQTSQISSEFLGDSRPTRKPVPTDPTTPKVEPTASGFKESSKSPDVTGGRATAGTGGSLQQQAPESPIASPQPQRTPGPTSFDEILNTPERPRAQTSSPAEKMNTGSPPIPSQPKMPDQFTSTPTSPLQGSGKAKVDSSSTPLPWPYSFDENQNSGARPELSHDDLAEAAKRREERKRLIDWCPLTPSSEFALALARSDDDEAFRLVPKKQTSQASSKKSGFWKNLRRTSGGADNVGVEEAAPVTDLLLAALCGLPKVTLALLESGTTIINSASEGNDDDWTPLCYAALGGSVAVAHQFMAAGYLINAANSTTPLCLAVALGRVKFATFLLERGAEPLAPRLRFGSALHTACIADNVELVKALSTAENALTTQCRILLPPTIPWLAPPDRIINDRKDELSCMDATPIGIAAYMNSTNVMEYLLAQNVDANSIITINGQFIRAKAISMAAINCANEAIRLLLKHGATASGDALRYATINWNTSTAQILTEAGAKAGTVKSPPEPSTAPDKDPEPQSPGPVPEPEASKRHIQERPLAVSLEEVFAGTTKKLRVRRKIYESTTGTVTEEAKILSVPIKRGLQVGSKIKYNECGDQMSENGPFADLHFILQYKDHPLFRREGNDIVSVLKLAEDEAKMLRSVKTIHGEDVPVGYYDFLKNEPKRFPGLGMPLSKTPELRGDFVVYLQVDGW